MSGQTTRYIPFRESVNESALSLNERHRRAVADAIRQGPPYCDLCDQWCSRVSGPHRCYPKDGR